MWHVKSYEFPFGSFTCHGVPGRKLKAGYNASKELKAFGKTRISKLFSRLCHLGFVFFMLFVLCFLRFSWYFHLVLLCYIMSCFTVTFTSSRLIGEMLWECLWCRSALSIFEETYCLEIRTSIKNKHRKHCKRIASIAPEITVVTYHFSCRWVSNNHVVT